MASELIELIRQKREEAARLRQQLREIEDELAEARSVLADQGAAIREARDAIRGARDAVAASAWRAPAPSSVVMAESVLSEAGRPMHVDQLLAAIQRRFGQQVRKDTLVGNISRHIKAGKTFERVAPSVFGLKPHGAASASESEVTHD
jgi:hypothetical protein